MRREARAAAADAARRRPARRGAPADGLVQRQILRRTTRQVTLTDAGTEYLARVEPILAALEEANHAVRGSTQLRGVLRIGLSSTFSFREIIPRLPIFCAQHPTLRVGLLMNGPLPDSSAVARKITSLNGEHLCLHHLHTPLLI